MLKPHEAIAYKYDASLSSGNPLFVISVRNVKQLVQILKLANKYAIDVVPRGGGTGLVGGAIPNNSIVVDLTKLNQIKIDAKKKTARVGAGATIAELNRAAARFGLFFPVEPASHEVCTIGGAISTDAGGLRVVKYGKMKEWIKRIDVITGEGKMIKNAKIDDFCGTEGVCGIVVSADLVLIAKPAQRSLSFFEFDNLEECISKAIDLRGNANLTALEFLDRHCAKIFNRKKYLLLAEFADDSGEIKNETVISEVWTKRDALYTFLCKDKYVHPEDPSFAEGEKIVKLIKWCEQNGFPIFGHIGAGIMHVHFPLERIGRRNEMWRLVKELGGVPGEHGIGLEKKEIVDERGCKKIAELKRKYDPNWILNKGKIVDVKHD